MMKPFIRKAGEYVWHTVVCVAILAWVMTVLWAYSYSQSVRRRHRAEQLLQDLKALPPGAAGFGKAHQIASKYGGTEHCTPNDCSYQFDIRFSFPDSGPPMLLRRTEWDYVGLRPWRVTASIQLRNDEVTYEEFDALVGRGRGWLYNDGLFSGNDWGWWAVTVFVSAGRFNQTASFEREVARENFVRTANAIKAGEQGIIVRKPVLNIGGGGEALQVYLSPDATPSRRVVGFDINLGCSTAMLPCNALCQVAPAAWQSYSAYQRSNGWAVDAPADCGLR